MGEVNVAGHERGPHVVMIVGNGIQGDSRVQKAALSAVQAGWKVTLVGMQRPGLPKVSRLGDVRIYRVSPASTLRQGRRPRLRWWSVPLRRTYSTDAERSYAEAAWKARDRDLATVIARLRQRLEWIDGGGMWPPLALIWRAQVIARIRLRRLQRTRVRAVHRRRQGGAERERLTSWARGRMARVKHRFVFVLPCRHGGWRKHKPALLDFDNAYGPVIQALNPDLIHAHDITMIGVAARASALLWRPGRDVPWIYDAHEWVKGLDYGGPFEARAYAGYEAEYIRSAAAVITVSEELSRLLMRRYRLPVPPVVVANAPVLDGTAGGPPVSLRRTVGLADGVPLVTYSGWLAPNRGVETVVRALVYLPDVHLALVVGRRSPHLCELEDLAAELGVSDRFHVAPYVPAHQVPGYLSSASVGICPNLHEPNHDVSLSTKYREYMHAGLPIVTSDVRTMSAFTREHGNGEVFTAGDARDCAQSIERVLASPARYTEAYRTDGFLQTHSWEHQAAKMMSLYEKVTGLRPRPRTAAWSVVERTDGKPRGSRTERMVGFGPLNHAGQAWAWAKALERLQPATQTEVFVFERDPLNFPADRRYTPDDMRSVPWQIENVWNILDRYTHLVGQSMKPVFGALNGASFTDDLPLIRGSGIEVAMVLHGSELRDPARHRERYPFSPFDPAVPITAQLTRLVARTNSALASFDGPLFVSTPDLLDDLPDATWLPVVVDLNQWAPAAPPLERDRPVVMHVPSNPLLKGSDAIEPAVQQLAAAGLITYRRLGKVPPEQMPDAIRDADIVLDQFALGSYGVLACQAMAAGRVVLCHVHDRVRERIPGDLPLVEATPVNIAEVIERVVTERDVARKTAAAGVEYVREMHSGDVSANILARFVGAPVPASVS